MSPQSSLPFGQTVVAVEAGGAAGQPVEVEVMAGSDTVVDGGTLIVIFTYDQ